MTKAQGPLYAVKFRRRRTGATDYATRLALLKSGKPRAVVRKSDRYILVQIVEYGLQGDRTICQASSRELTKYGFDGKCNTPSAYLTGVLAAHKALTKGVKAAVADIGRQTSTKGGIIFTAIKGVADGGLEMSVGAEILPTKERISGAHLKAAAAKFEAAKAKIISG